MRGREIAVAVGIVAILIGAGAGYLVGNANERNVTSTSTPVTTSTLTTTQQTIYSSSSTEQCLLLLTGCGPYPILKIQGANAQVGSQTTNPCQTTNFTAICPIDFVGGNSGKVMANVTFQAQQGSYIGGTYVAFLVYTSAARYVNFTSIPSCAYTSGASINAMFGCNVPTNGSVEFQFNFMVSPSYNSSSGFLDSMTVLMWQTCCLP